MQVGFGSGFKTNSCVWKALRPIRNAQHAAWAHIRPDSMQPMWEHLHSPGDKHAAAPVKGHAPPNGTIPHENGHMPDNGREHGDKLANGRTYGSGGDISTAVDNGGIQATHALPKVLSGAESLSSNRRSTDGS